MEVSSLTVLDLHKGPHEACSKAGSFLGLHPQEGVCKKNKDADGRYHRLAKPGKVARTIDPEEGI